MKRHEETLLPSEVGKICDHVVAEGKVISPPFGDPDFDALRLRWHADINGVCVDFRHGFCNPCPFSLEGNGWVLSFEMRPDASNEVENPVQALNRVWRYVKTPALEGSREAFERDILFLRLFMDMTGE